MPQDTPLAPDKVELAKKRSEFVKTMSEVVAGVQELAAAVGMVHPATALDRADEFLESVDFFLARIDLAAVGASKRAWLKTRLTFFIGAWLTRQHGGTWFLQEDPQAKFYLKTVVGGFESDASLTVDPAAIAARVLSTSPPGNLRTELANIGLDTNDTAPQVDIESVTARHAALVPKIRCTCGRAIWDFSGSRAARVTWVTEAEIDALGAEMGRLLAQWTACSTDVQRQAFATDVLGLVANEPVSDDRAAQEIAAIALASVGRHAYECEGCGRVWIAADNDEFAPYRPEGSRRNVLSGSTARTIGPPPGRP